MEIKGINIVNIPIPLPTGTKGIFHGDSISADAGASDHAHGYIAIYENLTGLQIRPMAQYSRTVQEGVQSFNVTNSLYNVVFNPTSDQAQYNPVFAYDPDYKYIFFRLGVNDALQKPGTSTNATTFKTIYKQCLQRFIDLGWPRNRLKLINIGSYLGNVVEVIQAKEDYNNAISEIGYEMNLQVIDLSSYDSTHNASTKYADDVHPNDAGHLGHATYIASQAS